MGILKGLKGDFFLTDSPLLNTEIRKMPRTRSQPELPFQEIIHLEQPQVDSLAIYHFVTEQGGQLKKITLYMEMGIGDRDKAAKMRVES